jgi:hypothetical protein
MEAIKQTVDFSAMVLFAIAAASILGLTIIGGVFWSNQKSIIIDEPFKIISDTSNYTCIVSEADNDLTLNCLETK